MQKHHDNFSKYSDRFSEIIKLSTELNIIQDYDILLEKILSHARKIVNADAGTIYIKDNNELVFSHTQNQTLQDRLPPGRKLIYNFFRIPINKKSISGYAALTGEVVNIPDVYKLSDKVPYKFNSKYDKISSYRTKSVLAVPLKKNIKEVAGVLQIINAKDNKGNIIRFAKDDEPFIIHFANTASLILERAQMTRALLMRMIEMAELHDPKETGAHVNRVASYSVEIYERWARRRKIDLHEIERNRDMLRMAAMLHDVGKIAISDVILKKSSKLTHNEYDIMKTHTSLGARLFKDRQSDFDEIARIVALNHHENWDGTGYPGEIDLNPEDFSKKNSKTNHDVKKRDKIPIFGRIVALADVFDALSSKRVYKEEWKEDDVFAEIKKQAGKKFDPELVEIFFEAINEIRAISERYKDE